MSETAVFSISNYTGTFQMQLAYFSPHKFILLIDMAYVSELLEVRVKRHFMKDKMWQVLKSSEKVCEIFLINSYVSLKQNI